MKLSEEEIKKVLPGIIQKYHQLGEEEIPFKDWEQEKRDEYYRDYGFMMLVLGDVFKSSQQ